MKSSLYLETTIPSYLTSRPSRDLIIAGHQELTREWWAKRRGAFQLYVSQLVVDEASAGDPVAARERLKVLQDLPLLDITPEDRSRAQHGFPGNLELRAHCECGDCQGTCFHLSGAWL
jgi:hypothetical protein